MISRILPLLPFALQRRMRHEIVWSNMQRQLSPWINVFKKKVALKIELFAFRYYIIYVTWISYIMTENERKLADLIVNYDRHIADAQEYIKENFGVSSEYVGRTTGRSHAFSYHSRHSTCPIIRPLFSLTHFFDNTRNGWHTNSTSTPATASR